MFIIITVIVMGLFVALFLFAASKPDVFRVQRAMSMSAPPEKIFSLVNDFHNWTSWSPWEKLDPTMKRSYSGTANGKGTVYAWEGKGKVGAGRMEITESISPVKVTIKLDFIKPFEGHNIAEFTFETKGGLTNVNWSMYGPQPYMGKVMSVFINMDRMIGKDFEAGLVNMKAVAEK